MVVAMVMAFAVVPMLPSLAVSAATDENGWQAELTTWRAQRAARLQAPEGWLSLIGLDWLRDGDNSFGSNRANRARWQASIRSFLRMLCVINFTLCAFATITSCPIDARCRLTHGECVPTSTAIRLAGILANKESNPALVVGI